MDKQVELLLDIKRLVNLICNSTYPVITKDIEILAKEIRDNPKMQALKFPENLQRRVRA